MKTNKESFSGYILVAFTCLFFMAAIQLSLGEVGWQIVGIQPIPEVVEVEIEMQEVEEVAILSSVVFYK